MQEEHRVVEAEQALVQVLPLLLPQCHQLLAPLQGARLILAVVVVWRVAAPAHERRLQLQQRTQLGELLWEWCAIVKAQQLLFWKRLVVRRASSRALRRGQPEL